MTGRRAEAVFMPPRAVRSLYVHPVKGSGERMDEDCLQLALVSFPGLTCLALCVRFCSLTAPHPFHKSFRYLYLSLFVYI